MSWKEHEICFPEISYLCVVQLNVDERNLLIEALDLIAKTKRELHTPSGSRVLWSTIEKLMEAKFELEQ